MADNASHTLASSATVRQTFNVEKDVVVIIRNGWTTKEEVLVAETQQEECYGWKCALEIKGLKVNLVKTMVMVSKIWQVTARNLVRNTHVVFVAEKQWQMQYYANLVER